jgi:putative N6-adenine-specific DNA methylase
VEHLFAACAPGLEAVLATELTALGLDARAVPGGAEARGRDALALACIGSRVADAVSLRIHDGPERELDAALAEARRRFGRGAPLAVRREGGRATVSLDAVGAPLYKRGWRARVGAAPLRESLAAGVLLLAGYDGESPLLDPMCGSGTIALEAAAIAARRAPGRDRRFAFERWPGTDGARVAAVRARLAARERAPPAPIHASDRNGGAVRLALKNAAAAGVEAFVRLERRDAAAAEAPLGNGLLVANPPYGLRLTEDVEAAWRALGVLLGRLPAWRVALLSSGQRPAETTAARQPAVVLRVRNGGLACQLLLYEPTGSP